MKKTDKILFIITILCAIVILTNCGYHLSGSGRSTLPEEANTIYIPDFNNPTANPNAQKYITFAIRDEFIKRSKLKLTDTITSADLVLEGKITNFLVKPMSYTDRMSANLYIVTLTLDVKLINTINNKIIYKNTNLRFSDNYDIDSSDFFSQETATLNKISKDIARTIVSGILENF